MSEWLKNLAGYMLAVSVAVQMLPDKKYEQYVKLFAGFVMIILVLQPVLKIGTAGTFLEEKINAFVQEQEELENAVLQQGALFEQESMEYTAQTDTLIEIAPVEEIKVEVTSDD